MIIFNVIIFSDFVQFSDSIYIDCLILAPSTINCSICNRFAQYVLEKAVELLYESVFPSRPSELTEVGIQWL